MLLFVFCCCHVPWWLLVVLVVVVLLHSLLSITKGIVCTVEAEPGCVLRSAFALPGCVVLVFGLGGHCLGIINILWLCFSFWHSPKKLSQSHPPAKWGKAAPRPQPWLPLNSSVLIWKIFFNNVPTSMNKNKKSRTAAEKDFQIWEVLPTRRVKYYLMITKIAFRNTWWHTSNRSRNKKTRCTHYPHYHHPHHRHRIRSAPHTQHGGRSNIPCSSSVERRCTDICGGTTTTTTTEKEYTKQRKGVGQSCQRSIRWYPKSQCWILRRRDTIANNRQNEQSRKHRWLDLLKHRTQFKWFHVDVHVTASETQCHGQ